jgi:hypothetical protein
VQQTTDTPLDRLKQDLSTKYPGVLVGELLSAYERIKENFYLARHEPAELNAGKLCEAVLRILEYAAKGTYTSIGTSTRNMGDRLRSFENQTKLSDSLRLHIPRVANALYHIRNSRGVGHIGGDVNPNLADATLVATGADWIIAEFVRLHYNCPLDEAQRIVDSLVQRRLPLVYAVGDKKRVLNPKLSAAQQVLLLLSGEFPGNVDDVTLFQWTDYSNLSVFRRDVLRALHARRQIEYSPPSCTILPPGLQLVEAHYAEWNAGKAAR